MVAEILSIGTELLLGQITDTNAAYLARVLASLGIDIYYKSTVGDNEGRIIEALQRARDRSDLIITSGGLGPTEDDLTKECIAKVFAEELVLDEPSLHHLEAFFARRGVEMPVRNRKQALIYRSGRALPNPNGTAPGALLEKDDKIVISLPGPPNELRPMVENTVIPLLTERLSGKRQYLVTRVFRFIGIGEGSVDEAVQDLLGSSNPTLAPLAHTGEVHLRAGAKADSLEAAEALLQPLEAELRKRLGRYLYGTNDTNLEMAVVQMLAQRGLTVSVAESCTGGLLGARLTSVAGSSEVFQGGVISYANEAKMNLLGVDPALLRQYGAVSPQVAEAMACGVRERLGADFGISITGIAGPGGGTPTKPVGLVYIGVAGQGKVWAVENHFFGVREDVRRRATQVALQLIRDTVLSG